MVAKTEKIDLHIEMATGAVPTTVASASRSTRGSSSTGPGRPGRHPLPQEPEKAAEPSPTAFMRRDKRTWFIFATSLYTN